LRIKDEKKREKLQKAGYNQEKITEAPELIVITTRRNIVKDDVEKLIDKKSEVQDIKKESLNELKSILNGFVENHDKEFFVNWTNRQAYIALGVGLVVAAQLGVDAGPMEGFVNDKVDEILDLYDSDYKSVAMVAFGYRDENDQYADYPKVRYDKNEVIEII
jgi:nitroreductase